MGDSSGGSQAAWHCWPLCAGDCTLVTMAVVLRLHWQQEVLLGGNRKEEFWQGQAALWEMGVNQALQGFTASREGDTQNGSVPCE